MGKILNCQRAPSRKKRESAWKKRKFQKFICYKTGRRNSTLEKRATKKLQAQGWYAVADGFFKVENARMLVITRGKPLSKF